MVEPLVVKFIGDLSDIKRQIGGITPTGGGGAAGRGGSQFAAMTGALTKLTAGIGILIGVFQQSKRLQRAVELLTRPFNQLLALFGDLLALGLMPLVQAMRPITRFVRDLRRQIRKGELFGIQLDPKKQAEALQKKLDEFLDALFPDAPTAGAARIKELVTGIINTINTILTAVTLIFPGLTIVAIVMRTLILTVTGWILGIATTFKNINLSRVFTSMKNRIVIFISNMGNRILDFLRGLFDSLKSAFSAIASSFAPPGFKTAAGFLGGFANLGAAPSAAGRAIDMKIDLTGASILGAEGEEMLRQSILAGMRNALISNPHINIALRAAGLLGIG